MLSSLALTTLLVVASASDLRRFRIPNVIPLLVIGLGMLDAMTTAGPWPWPGHLTAFGLVLTLGFMAFAGGLIGGGDAKLMAALAFWFGPSPTASLLAITAIAGGLLALVLMVLRQLLAAEPAAAIFTGRSTAPVLLRQGAPIPYALPITFAALWLEWFAVP